MTKKITDLDPALPLTGAEIIPLVQNVVTRRSPLSALADWVLKTYQGFLQSGTGAVARTVAGKLGEVVSVKDFGAMGDGVTDDTAAIQASLTAVASTGGGFLYFDGIYRLTENAGGVNQTRFSIASSNTTLVFSARTKFLVKSDSAITTVFYLDGVSNFETIGSIRVESDASTPFSTNGAYGAKALLISNANGSACGNIKIDSVHITRGSGGVFINGAHSNSNRIVGVSIGKIYTKDATYGLNAQNNGDNVQCGMVETDGAFRSFFVYGAKNYNVKVRALNQYSAGTPINCTQYSLAEGGSGTNTENIDVEVEIEGGAPSVVATCRHIGDGGTTQVMSNIYIRCKAKTLPATGLQLTNFDVSGGASSATPFAAQMQNITFENMSTNAAFSSAIGTTPSSWVTKPKVFWYGPASMSQANYTSLTVAGIIDLWVSPYLGFWAKDPITLNNQVFLRGTKADGTVVNLAGVDSGGNRLFGSSTTEAIWGASYGGSGGYYINVNGASRVQFTDAILRPQTDNAMSLGSGSQRWSTVYAATGSINTSDERAKEQWSAISQAERNVAVKAKALLKSFKFKDAIELKGDDARIHFGIGAQSLKAAFESEGLIAENYAVLCYDEWDEQQEIVDADGNTVEPYRPAGNRYGVRYEELLAFIIAAL